MRFAHGLALSLLMIGASGAGAQTPSQRALTSARSSRTAAPTHSRSSGNRTVLIGKLGQALASVPIRRIPSDRSSRLYTVRAWEYLIVQTTKANEWYAVVMENRSLGYVRSNSVARLPYDVTLKAGRSTYNNLGVANAGAASESAGMKGSLANYALNYTGTPYRWGGNSLNKGIDCSGFVQQLFGKIGMDLPRTAAQQALVGQSITQKENLIAGDRLYFYDRKRGRIGHTGIYLGNGFFVHSSSGRGGVATDDLRQDKWSRLLVAARR